MKKQRFIDHSLWLTTTAKDLSPPTPAPFLKMDEGKQTHRRYEKTEQDGDNTAATRQATKANKDFENRRHPQKRLQQDIMKMRHDQAPLRHPIEELCGISIQIKDVWFLAEQPIDLPFSLLGAVVGANYSFRLAISDSQVRKIAFTPVCACVCVCLCVSVSVSVFVFVFVSVSVFVSMPVCAPVPVPLSLRTDIY